MRDDTEKKTQATSGGSPAGASGGAGGGAGGAAGGAAGASGASGSGGGAAGASGAGSADSGASRSASSGNNPQRRRQRGTGLGSTRVKDRARLSERMRSSTRVRLFTQATIFDFILVLVTSVALSLTVSFAFNSAAEYRGNIWIVTLMTLPLLIALYVGTWSKRALLPSIIATVVVVVAEVGVAMAISPAPMFEDGAMLDVADNYGIFAIVICVVSILTFLLSRRTVTLAILLIGAIIACGVVQFLYRDWAVDQPGILVTLFVMFGIGMLFVYQCYKQSIYSANRLKKTSFPAAFVFSVVIGAICVLIGAGVFYGIVQATDLETPEIKLFESYVSPPVDDTSNSFETDEDYDDDTSDETDEDQDMTDEEDEGDENQQDNGMAEGFLSSTFIGDLARSLVGYDEGDDLEQVQWMIRQLETIIAIIIIVLIVVLIIVLMRLRRRWRLSRIEKRSKAYQAWYLYEFFLKRFRRLRFKKPEHLTPFEFAIGYERAMRPFTRRTEGVDFVELTSLYEDVAYGSYEPTDEEMSRVKRYYHEFFKNARQYTGWPKWIFWRFWRI